MDVRMPEMDGIEATRLICGETAEVRVLILTTFDLDAYVYRALRAGASGLLLNDTRPVQLGGFLAGADLAPFAFGQATEDAMVKPVFQGVGQAFGTDRAAGADSLRLRHLPCPRAHLGHGEEQFRVLIPAGGPMPPV